MANKYTIKYCEERLEKGGSVDYRSWLTMTIRTLKETGECPTVTEVGKSFNNLKLWNGEGVEELQCGKVLYDSHAYINGDDVYEMTKDCTLFKMNCTASEYRRYVSPMPYNVYITG